MMNALLLKHAMTESAVIPVYTKSVDQMQSVPLAFIEHSVIAVREPKAIHMKAAAPMSALLIQTAMIL